MCVPADSSTEQGHQRGHEILRSRIASIQQKRESSGNTGGDKKTCFVIHFHYILHMFRTDT